MRLLKVFRFARFQTLTNLRIYLRVGLQTAEKNLMLATFWGAPHFRGFALRSPAALLQIRRHFFYLSSNRNREHRDPSVAPLQLHKLVAV
jgi:hypothetical protein